MIVKGDTRRYENRVNGVRENEEGQGERSEVGGTTCSHRGTCKSFREKASKSCHKERSGWDSAFRCQP